MYECMSSLHRFQRSEVFNRTAVTIKPIWVTTTALTFNLSALNNVCNTYKDTQEAIYIPCSYSKLQIP